MMRVARVSHYAGEQKLPKSAVKYEHPAKMADHCGICRYFMPQRERCRIVAGIVLAEDWCNRFEKRE